MKASHMFLVAMLALLPACNRSPTMTHSCRIGVRARASGETVRASGSAPTEAAATESAWTNVCAALSEAARATCRDSSRYSSSVATASMNAGAGTTYTVTISLEPRQGEEVRGQGTSSNSSDEACAQAMREACTAAGATGDCVAAGTHELGMRSTSSMRSR